MDTLFSLLFENCFSYRRNTEDEYEGSGCIFTDENHYLAGYQPNKKNPMISGIGGSKEEGETYIITAIREAIEELFEVNVKREIINDIQMYIMPRRIIKNGSYVIVKYSFEDLQYMMKIIRSHRIVSPLYDKIPINILELIFNRKIDKSSEISHLAILPLVKCEGDFVGNELLSDINLLLTI